MWGTSFDVCMAFMQIPVSPSMFSKASMPVFVPEDNSSLGKVVNKLENPDMKINVATRYQSCECLERKKNNTFYCTS